MPDDDRVERLREELSAVSRDARAMAQLDRAEEEIRQRNTLRGGWQTDHRSYLALETIADELTRIRVLLQIQNVPPQRKAQSPGE